MNRGKELLKNTFILTISKICTQFITFLLLPVYTTILTTEEYGIVDLVNNLVLLCVPIVTFQIERALFRYLIDSRENEEKTKGIITTTIFVTLIQCIIYIIIFSMVSQLIKNDYKYFLLTNVIATIFSSIMLQMVRGLGDNKKYAIGSFITASSTVLLNILFIVFFRWGAYGMILATLMGNLLCCIYITVSKKIYRYIKFNTFDKTILKKMWKYSIPLIPSAISWWIFNSSDRIIVTAALGIEQNGILSAAYKFSNVYIALYGILDMAWTETAALHIEDEDNNKFFTETINIILKFFVALCFGIIACMPIIFPLMINKKFSEAYNQIPILMIASLCNVIVGVISVVYLAKKDTNAVAKTAIVSAIVNVSVNLVLIKYIGLYAASISTLVAYLSMAIYRYIDVQKYIKIKIEKKLLLQTIIMILFLFIVYYINNSYLNAITIIITIVYAWIFNKNSIKILLKMLGKRLKKSEK